MKHLGDITKIKNPPFVDCITFGSPCQDLSIAGKGAGLAGERSGLFMEAIRVIKEMRLKSGGVYPTFAVWENVPGAFSSNRGDDFRTVLEELAKIKEPEVSIPRPKNGRWAKAGFICGNGWSIAWRTIDAQYWGVPQRRRRIAVVTDFGGQRAGEILFERAGMSRDLEPSIPPWEGIARDPSRGTVGYDRVVERPGECLNPFCIQGNIIDRTENSGVNGVGIRNDDVSYTLSTVDRHAVAYGISSYASNAMRSPNPHSGIYVADTSRTLDLNGGNPACNQGGIVVCQPVLCRAHGQSNAETLNDMSPTLSCNREQPIVFESHSQDARYTQQGNTSPTCTARWGTGGNNMPIVVEKHGFSCCGYGKYNECIGTLRASGGDSGGGSENIIAECITLCNDTVASALMARDYKGVGRADSLGRVVEVKLLSWIVRRLTPMECERLQGFPDGWTDIGEWVDSKGKRRKSSDSSRYKALGNSIALPQWWWITCKMAAYLPEHATLGSLFDGIGGFPLVWETYHGKGTAIWASEIEEFPIAVTKERFNCGH